MLVDVSEGSSSSEKEWRDSFVVYGVVGEGSVIR